MGGMGDGDREVEHLYYNDKKKRWQTCEWDDEHYVVYRVYYWTDVNTYEWIEADGPSINIHERLKAPHPALAEAWAEVEAAVERYRVIEELTNTQQVDR
jgi:hypothetical protein